MCNGMLDILLTEGFTNNLCEYMSVKDDKIIYLSIYLYLYIHLSGDRHTH